MRDPEQQHVEPASVRLTDAKGEESKRLSRKADQLQASLDQVARAHGYLSYSHMQQRITADVEAVDKDSRKRLLKKLLPLSSSPTPVASGVVLPPADLAGLTPEPDIARSLARLIRVLLLGYTQEEIHELSERMRAARVQELEARAPDRDDRHHRVIEWMDQMNSPSSLKVTR